MKLTEESIKSIAATLNDPLAWRDLGSDLLYFQFNATKADKMTLRKMLKSKRLKTWVTGEFEDVIEDFDRVFGPDVDRFVRSSFSKLPPELRSLLRDLKQANAPDFSFRLTGVVDWLIQYGDLGEPEYHFKKLGFKPVYGGYNFSILEAIASSSDPNSTKTDAMLKSYDLTSLGFVDGWLRVLVVEAIWDEIPEEYVGRLMESREPTIDSIIESYFSV